MWILPTTNVWDRVFSGYRSRRHLNIWSRLILAPVFLNKCLGPGLQRHAVESSDGDGKSTSWMSIQDLQEGQDETA